MEPILKVNNLKKSFFKKKSFLETDEIKAVNEVSFNLGKGSILGLVGESGCGKTTTGRCIVGLERVTSGEIWYEDKEIGSLNAKQFSPIRKKIQMVFQDPTDSLNPHFTVRATIKEPLDLNTKMPAREKEELLERVMEIVGLRKDHLSRYPHQLSTGQQQRVGIARAVICNPNLVVLDEPTAALDVSVKGKVIEMLLDIQANFAMTYLLISHDLSTIQFICNETAVMYLGFIVEKRLTKELFDNPLHPYTHALITAAPSIDFKNRKQRVILKGEVPSPIDLPSGCPFHKRCREKQDICLAKRPKLRQYSERGGMVACHLYT